MVALLCCSVALKGRKPPPQGYPKEINTLGDHIRRRRMDLHLLQKDAAQRIGVDVCTINNWERQRTAPEIRQMSEIIRFLGYDPLPQPTDLKERIMRFRMRQGMTQKELAKWLGIDPATLASWETGRHRPSRRSLRLIGREELW
jgi:DNA-binding XRE family transcriptional regulator